MELFRFRLQDSNLLWLAFPHHSASKIFSVSVLSGPTTPDQQAHLVWASPFSLATTQGIISFPLGT